MDITVCSVCEDLSQSGPVISSQLLVFSHCTHNVGFVAVDE